MNIGLKKTLERGYAYKNNVQALESVSLDKRQRKKRGKETRKQIQLLKIWVIFFTKT